jgi:hypothetical protein
MFWWRDPEERTFEATSGISVAVVENDEKTFYRVTLLQPMLQPCQAGSVRVGKEEAEV